MLPIDNIESKLLSLQRINKSYNVTITNSININLINHFKSYYNANK